MRSPVSPADQVPALANTTPAWKRAWIAVAVAGEVPDNAPVQVLVAGDAWVVSRMDGTLTAFEDVCPHRQSPLSAGAVTRAEDGTPRLTCAFHGWRFDATGKCDLMPTEGGGIFGRHRHGGHGHRGWHGWAGGHHGHGDDAKHGERTSLRPAYGVTERYGLIWLAAQEPLAPLPEFPELGVAGSGAARVRTVSTHASAGQVINGFLDAGPRDSPEVTTEGWQVVGVFDGRYRITKTAGPHATAHVRADLPHARVGILLTCQPEDFHTTRVYALGTRIDGEPGRAPEGLTPGAAHALEAEHMAAVERDLAALEASPSPVLPLDVDAAHGTPLSSAWRTLMARAIQALSPPVTISVMGYDEGLANRIRDLIGPDPELTEKKMFGGLAFLIREHMAISASGQGGVLLHVDPARTEELTATTKATVAVMQGREMPGWLRVAAEHVATDGELSPWVEMGIEHARSLPPKKPAPATKTARAASRK